MAKAKEIEGLDCGAGAARGMWLVLSTRLEEMCEQRAAVLGPEGEEGVHDMRVASRRLRSVLRDFRPHMRGGRRLEAAREELKQLAAELGAVRDEDVAIHALEKLKEEAPESAARGLELFAEERRRRRESEQAELARALELESFESFRRRVARAFEKATAPKESKGDVEKVKGGEKGAGGSSEGGGAGEGSEQSFGELGLEIIARSWEELQARGPDIYRPLKSKRLHKLRIRAKRLRYALELFAACHGEALRELAHELARLQTALGELHDCDGWVEECGKYLSERGDTEEASPSDADADARREAAFWLLEHFAEERARHYAEALEIWRGWEREDLKARMKGKQ
jgi:CHAD domain-containing protein